MKIFEADNLFRDQINQFYLNQGYHGRWSDTERAFISLADDQIIGSVKIECINGISILRGMYIHSQYQNMGLGTKFLKYIEPVLNKTPAYCMPLSHVADFYRTIDFREVAISEYPIFLQKRCKEYQAAGYRIKTMVRQVT